MGGADLVAIISAIVAAVVTIVTGLLSFRSSSRKQLSDDETELRKVLSDELQRCLSEKRDLLAELLKQRREPT